MALRTLGLLTLILLQSRSNASVMPPRELDMSEDVAVEDLKDLLLESMQNTVSLNDLVTKLTQKIVDIMLTLGDAKTEMEQMRQTHSTEIEELKNEITSIKATTDTDFENVKEALAGVSTNVSTGMEQMRQTHSTEIEGLKDEITSIKATTDTDIENVKEDLAGVRNNFESLGSDIEELRVLEAQTSRDVTIISSEEAPGNPRCAKVCAGTTGRTATNWRDSGYGSAVIFTDVDISGCGFVSVPTITTSMEGSSSHRTATGTSSVSAATTNTFRIYLDNVAHARGGGASSYKYNIEWVAVGYTC